MKLLQGVFKSPKKITHTSNDGDNSGNGAANRNNTDREPGVNAQESVEIAKVYDPQVDSTTKNQKSECEETMIQPSLPIIRNAAQTYSAGRNQFTRALAFQRIRSRGLPQI